MRRDTGCQPLDHAFSRRSFLAGSALAGTVAGVGHAVPTIAGEQIQRRHKQVLQVFLQGGVSQLESWDPKPGTRHGGPFGAIPTSVPGVHISELLPETAQQMHHLSIVRSVNIKINDHGQGRMFMEKGRRAGDYPYVGSVAAKYLGPDDSRLPKFITISTRGLNDQSAAAFLGAKYTQLKLSGAEAPANLNLPKGIDTSAEQRRQQLRLAMNERFASGRRKAHVETYNASFEQAQRMVKRRDVFVAEPTPQDLDRYGRHEFARNCVLARTLLEEGVTCVKVSHHGYDTHAENFNFHLEQLGEFDRPFATLLADLADRGMLEHTLVMVYSEFGRTPKINVRYGRDHWGTAWSVALGGCGIVPGAVIGKTNDEGTAVADREVDAGHLFHTYFSALGIDTFADHDVPGRSIPIGDPAAAPIKELLA